ncbi:MAG: type A2 lanthipeptide [Catonella sp.]
MLQEKILAEAIEEVPEMELEEIAGGKKGCGWFCTITDDCPNLVFVCC